MPSDPHDDPSDDYLDSLYRRLAAVREKLRRLNAEADQIVAQAKERNQEGRRKE
jgi:hypothetical protein